MIAAKSKDPHPKLPGTIYTAAEEIEQEIAALQPRINKLRKEREAAKSAAFQRPRGATPHRR